jgi:hypothetical protein
LGSQSRSHLNQPSRIDTPQVLYTFLEFHLLRCNVIKHSRCTRSCSGFHACRGCPIGGIPLIHTSPKCLGSSPCHISGSAVGDPMEQVFCSVFGMCHNVCERQDRLLTCWSDESLSDHQGSRTSGMGARSSLQCHGGVPPCCSREETSQSLQHPRGRSSHPAICWLAAHGGCATNSHS